MIKRFLLLFSYVILGTMVLKAQTNKIEFVEFDMKNGLHVILHQDNTTPIVAVTVMYHVGAKNERPDRTGFAHFFEHLMFEGTDNIGRGEYSKIVERNGGTLNANTTQDRTFYYEVLPSNQLELGLWLESERMLHAKVDSVGIKTQKKVVIEEKKQSVDNRPYGTLLQEVMNHAYTVHPYRWTTIGNAEHIMSAKDQEFQEFYKTYYVPNNAVLCIAGDIKIDDAKKLVEKYFNDIPKGTNVINRPKSDVEPALKSEVRDTVFDNIQLPLVIQAYRIPAMGTPDYFAVSLLGTLMSEGESSRLYKTLVDEQQKALQVAAFPFEMEHPGVSLMYAMPNMGVDPKDLEDALNAQIVKLQTELISDKELQKLKNQTEREFVTGNASIATRATNLCSYYTYFKNANLINTDVDNYMKVTKEDIQRVAKKYFTPENRVVLYYLPKQK